MDGAEDVEVSRRTDIALVGRKLNTVIASFFSLRGLIRSDDQQMARSAMASTRS